MQGPELIDHMMAHGIDPQDLSHDQIHDLIKPGTRRSLRLVSVFNACARVMKEDVKVHPWKLFFYILPIPPFGAVAVAAGTMLHIALGFTKTARGYRKQIVEASRKPLDLNSFAVFMSARKADPKKKKDKPHLAVNWASLRNSHFYYMQVELLNLGIDWSSQLPKNRLSNMFNKSMERQIISMRLRQTPKELHKLGLDPSLKI
jgi:hypothetical protein